MQNIPPQLSVVVPVYNEAENVALLVSEIHEGLQSLPYEMIFVDDASQDATREKLVELMTDFPSLRAISHQRNAGQSRAIRTGIKAAQSPIIATLDGDGQNDPADIAALYKRLNEADPSQNLAMIGGRRAKRRDNLAKRLGSRFGNGIRKRLLKDGADDTGCGLKVFYRAAFLDLPYFDHIHRYLPALMRREGFAIDFMDVNHRQREFGHSKYTNFGRLIVSIADLRGVIWLLRRARQPGICEEHVPK